MADEWMTAIKEVAEKAEGLQRYLENICGMCSFCLSERTGSFPLEMRQIRLASGFRLTENRRISVRNEQVGMKLGFLE